MTLRPFILLSLVVCGTQSVNSRVASTGSKVSPRRPTVNETFFNGPFNLCKGTRVQNPVELVHAHVFTTKIFSAVGRRNMIDLAVEHKIPAYGLYPLGDKVCLLMLVMYSSLSEESVMILPKNISGERCVKSVLYLMMAAQKSSSTLSVKHGNQKFNLHWQSASAIVRFFCHLWSR